MGIVNVTPDSFSDGGEAFETSAAVARGRAMAAAGADILDIGGESTRPGSAPVSEEEERRRVLPVIEALAAEGLLVSIDSRRAGIIADALTAGARIVNDVTALTGDAKSMDVVAASAASVILMHMRGEPATMQDAPAYDDAPTEVRDYLAARVAACEAAGIARHRIAVDPGIGFGKTLTHNLEILNRWRMLHEIGCAVVLGASRKSFIGALSGESEARARVPGSLATALAARARGAQIFRVHDVAETHQALRVFDAIANAGA